MDRPKMALENYKEVYDYYRQYEPSVKPMQRAYTVAHHLFHPRISQDDLALYDLDKIGQDKTPHIYVSNHLNKYDQAIIGATMHEIAPDDIGHTRALSADFHFHRFYGSLCDGIGGIPVFRRRDHQDAADLHDVQEELFNTFRDLLAAGQKVEGFPEGIPNKTDDPTTLLKIRSGIGEIAHRTAVLTDGPVAITPMGISYGRERKKIVNPFGARAHVGRSVFVTPETGVAAITRMTRSALQYAVTLANESY